MADHHNQHDADWHKKANDEPDRELDSALAMYAAVEPRAGLEQRILANLRTARDQRAGLAWWRRSVTGWTVVAAAAVVIFAVAVALRSAKPARPDARNHPARATQTPHEPPRQVVTNEPEKTIRRHSPGPAQRSNHRSDSQLAAAAPKLDQFPSPHPLSDQEKLLARYVAEYPEHAVLVARAQAEALRRDQEEEMRYDGRAHDNDSPQQNK